MRVDGYTGLEPREKGCVMIYCPKCGTQLPDESLFCGKCGSLLPQQTAPAQPAQAPVASAPAQAPFAGVPAQNPYATAQPSATYFSPAMPAAAVAQAKPRSKKLPLIIVGLVAIAAILGAGFFTNWFGLGKEPVYVVTKMTQTTSAQTITAVYNIDAQGACQSITANNGSSTETVTFTRDSNGYPLQMTARTATVTAQPTFDGKNRITQAVFTQQGDSSTRVTATYAYYGDSDHLQRITYAIDTTSRPTDSISTCSNIMQLGISPYLTVLAGAVDSNGKAQGYVDYDEDGRCIGFTTADGQYTATKTLPKSSRKSQTLTDDSSGIMKTTTTYDENGNTTQTIQRSASDDSVMYQVTYERTRIDNPTHCNSIFNRLY